MGKYISRRYFCSKGNAKRKNVKVFDGGLFPPVMDGPTHLFHKWVAKIMLAKLNKKIRTDELLIKQNISASLSRKNTSKLI